MAAARHEFAVLQGEFRRAAVLVPMDADVDLWSAEQIRALLEKGTGAATIGRAYRLTSSIMCSAVDDGVIAVSPRRNVDLPEIAAQPPPWFTLDQAESILDELPLAWRGMCLIGFYTGLR